MDRPPTDDITSGTAPDQGAVGSADRCPVGELDLHLLFEGTHSRLHDAFGAQPTESGCWFSVWAPNARAVRVLCEHDGFADHQLEPHGDSGVWTAHLQGPRAGHSYHYRITTADGTELDKADPVAAAASEPPSTTSRIAELHHEWRDSEWMAERGSRVALDAPVSIYEVHLGSWGRTLPTGEHRFPTYEELADPLADHVLAHGFTHVELLPINEHPFYGSWGYQTTGYFAPTSRYGSPQQLMAMIDRLHQRGVGVIVDWVPSHFPFDPHGLANFDGTALYEHADPRQGYHPDWNSAVFNYGRNEVRAFLRSSAMCWLERYHVDAIRVDAVASMLYLDYSREAGEWVPNEFGGRENLEAIGFLRDLNETIYAEHPDVATFAEESTSWPMVSRPTYIGGLGFGFKWDMGWMHDTLQYMGRDPIHRSYHHGEITFRSVYAFSENFTLPLSHDEVVHGKGSILARMPGDDWQRFANVRLLYGMQWSQPGKKLLFMGNEMAMPTEWNHEGVIDWSLHDSEGHVGVRRWVAALNELYRDEPALHLLDSNPDGFSWIIGDDAEHSVFVWARTAPGARPVVVVVNATPSVHHHYRIGVPMAGTWREVANSDDLAYGGSGVSTCEAGTVETTPVDSHGHFQSISVSVPPLAVAVLAAEAT
jgi:1,4-alpha-glucan branching enzyme